MLKQIPLFDFYIDYIKEFNVDIICSLDEGEISYYEAEFPSNANEMKDFINAFEHIFPEADHNLFPYINLLNGLNIMEQAGEFTTTETYLDIVDYIREEALEELQNQISNYPQKREKEGQYFDFKGYIEELNEKLGFDGNNSEIIHEGTGEYEGYDISIEGNHYTTLQINLEHQDLEKHLKSKDLEMFILESYESAIVDFDVDDVFDELYDAVSSQYRASEFLNMLKEDKIFFTSTIRDAISKTID